MKRRIVVVAVLAVAGGVAGLVATVDLTTDRDGGRPRKTVGTDVGPGTAFKAPEPMGEVEPARARTYGPSAADEYRRRLYEQYFGYDYYDDDDDEDEEQIVIVTPGPNRGGAGEAGGPGQPGIPREERGGEEGAGVGGPGGPGGDPGDD